MITTLVAVTVHSCESNEEPPTIGMPPDNSTEEVSGISRETMDLSISDAISVANTFRLQPSTSRAFSTAKIIIPKEIVFTPHRPTTLHII